MYEPVHHDVHILSKKIPITKFLNLQVYCFLPVPSFFVGRDAYVKKYDHGKLYWFMQPDPCKFLL